MRQRAWAAGQWTLTSSPQWTLTSSPGVAEDVGAFAGRGGPFGTHHLARSNARRPTAIFG